MNALAKTHLGTRMFFSANLPSYFILWLKSQELQRRNRAKQSFLLKQKAPSDE